MSTSSRDAAGGVGGAEVQAERAVERKRGGAADGVDAAAGGRLETKAAGDIKGAAVDGDGADVGVSAAENLVPAPTLITSKEPEPAAMFPLKLPLAPPFPMVKSPLNAPEGFGQNPEPLSAPIVWTSVRMSNVPPVPH